MAGGGILPSQNGQAYEGKLTAYVVLASLVAASGGLLFGYDIGVTGGVTAMPDFLRTFFPDVYIKESIQTSGSTTATNAWCKFDSQILQLFTSSLFLAGIFGGFLASFTTSRFGRVRTMLAAGFFFLGGAALTAGAIGVYMLVIGRILLGLGVGAANQSVPLYLSEMAPAKLRGALNMMFQMATTLGILAGQLIDFGTAKMTPYGWRISLGLAGVPALILTIGGLFLPETPNSLIERGRYEKGKQNLQKIRGMDMDVQAEYEDMVAASEQARLVQASCTSILRRQYRPELTWAILIPFFQQMTGINAIMFYATPLFNSLGFGSDAALYSAVITGAVNVAATLASILTVDWVGRRALFLTGGFQMLIMQVAIGVLLALEFGDGTRHLSDAAAMATVAIICLYVAGFACSWGALGWLVPSEIQPLEVRSTGQSITVAVNFLFTFIIGQGFLSMLCNFRYGIFFFFGGWVLIMTLVVYLFLPETKGVPLEEMHLIWRKHWFWKRVVPPQSKDFPQGHKKHIQANGTIAEHQDSKVDAC